MLRLRLVILGVLLLGSNALAQETAVQVEVLAKETVMWNGVTLPAYPQGQPELTIQKFTIPGNTSLAWHLHPVINAGYMLAGKLTVITKEGDTLHLETGDTLIETVGTWHQGINEYPEAVEILVFYAGIVDTPLAIEETH